MPYDVIMQTVIETSGFLRDADQAGMTKAEIEKLVSIIAANPEAGAVIQGTGGCRKVRIAGRGKGKSGGYRVITFYSGPEIPAFLLTVFGKGEKDNLTKSERNGLAVLTKELVASYRK